MNPQEQFEAVYADYTQTPIEQIVAARLGEDSYNLRNIFKAHIWYKFGVLSGQGFNHKEVIEYGTK